MEARRMKGLIPFAAALVLAAAPARADHESAAGAAHEALEAQAEAPRTPPTLPDSASARAHLVQETIAHGKKGAEERAAHAKDGDADSDGPNKSAQGAAASAAKSANADSHDPAGQARATEKRGGNPPGGGHGHDQNPGHGHH
jgi:hypothetical protein